MLSRAIISHCQEWDDRDWDGMLEVIDAVRHGIVLRRRQDSKRKPKDKDNGH